MGILGETEKRREVFRHGGNEVMVLSVSHPTGESPAARQMAALAQALSDFARERVQSDAKQALEAAVSQGKGHLFTRYVCRVSVAEEEKRGWRQLTLTFSVTAGRVQIWRSVLETRWDAAGQIQFPPRRRKTAKRGKNRERKAFLANFASEKIKKQ